MFKCKCRPQVRLPLVYLTPLPDFCCISPTQNAYLTGWHLSECEGLVSGAHPYSHHFDSAQMAAFDRDQSSAAERVPGLLLVVLEGDSLTQVASPHNLPEHKTVDTLSFFKANME